MDTFSVHWVDLSLTPATNVLPTAIHPPITAFVFLLEVTPCAEQLLQLGIHAVKIEVLSSSLAQPHVLRGKWLCCLEVSWET